MKPIFAPAKKRTVGNDITWRYYLIEVPIDIQSLWLSINISLAKENIDDPLTTWNTTVVEKCIEFLKDKRLFLEVWWQKLELDRWGLSEIVADIATDAFACDKNVFKVDILTPEENLWKFTKENKDKIEELNSKKRLVNAKQLQVVDTPTITMKDVINSIKWIEEKINELQIVSTDNVKKVKFIKKSSLKDITTNDEKELFDMPESFRRSWIKVSSI